jgi:D-alanyl-D-alanine carboxypeptidase
MASKFVMILASACMLQPVTVRGAVSLDGNISQIRQDYGGVGLTAWSVDSVGKLCSLGVSGERIKGSGELLQSTGDSRDHIGSDTKSMTATLLAILIEDGTIGKEGWETSLGTLLAVAQGTSHENLTLRELVAHLSGIPEAPTNETVIPDFDPNDIRDTRRAYTEAALTTPPVFKPGTAFLYSNSNYVVAGAIIEELTNATWEEVLAERLFLPLGIDLGQDPSAYTGAPNNGVDPWGHSGDNQVPCDPSVDMSKCDNAPWSGPAGTFSGPLAAVARYLSWHVQCHNGAVPEGDTSSTLLSQASCQTLHQPGNATISVYGYGWECVMNQDWAGGLACVHSGSNTWNFFTAWLAFGIDRAYAGFTNSARSNDTDYFMVDAAIGAAILGDEDCQSRIPSLVYTTAEILHLLLRGLQARQLPKAPRTKVMRSGLHTLYSC